MKSPAGTQLSGDELYKRQQAIRNDAGHSPAPTIIAEHLASPENWGAAFRLADAVGSQKLIFISDRHLEGLPSKAKRTSRNCEAHVDYELLDEQSFWEQRIQSLPPLVALELTTESHDIFHCPLPLECAFVIGNERHGISSRLLDHCALAVHIPMFGVNGSMNVVQALGISLYEWRRRNARSQALK